MKQLVLFNPGNFGITVGIRVELFDKLRKEEELCKFEGYSISFRDNDSYDGWLLFSGQEDAPEDAGPWVWVKREYVDDKIEIIGEL